jgi:hypothetical protein
MTIPKRLSVAFVLSAVITGGTLLAQTSSSPQPAAPTGGRSGQPCWKQAGISSSAMPQLRQIRQTTRSQMESVRNDSSLTPQQKQQKEQQLKHDAYQQADSLVGSQQLQALRSCQQQRTGNRSGSAPR